MGDHTITEIDAVGEAREHLNRRQRARLGPVEALGDAVISVGVVYMLWNDVPRVPLIAWALIIALSSWIWEALNRAIRDRRQESDSLLTWYGWVTTIVWGALPWIAWSGLGDRGVVWVLVFVAIFSIGTDTVFVTQTSSISVDEMVVAYTASFLLAFGATGNYAPIVAVLAAGATFVVGGAGLGQVTGELVTQRVESERKTRVDDLTGVGTRAAAIDAIEAMIAAGAEEIHCAFFDLDDFKQLNDNYGYDVGDAALRIVAVELTELLPANWTVARFGGDEFVAVGDTPANIGALNDIPISLAAQGGISLSQPLSMGITSRPATDFSADELFLEGASALRAAKRMGKRQMVEMSDALRNADRTRAELGSRAGEAIDRREIVPWAQPIVGLQSERIVGIELLPRWPQADGSVIMPGEFVPVLEAQGRGPALGLLMIDHALKALAGPELRHSSIYVTVNLSAKHLFHRRLPVEIADLLLAADVDPSRLVLEIAEAKQLPSSPIWAETARRLRETGVGLAIDDFGTGFSSMSQLLTMPFTHLKIDRLITRTLSRPGGADMASAIVAMSKGFDMTTIVEGVENETERSVMINAGCKYGQGFLFGKAAPLASVLQQATTRRSPDVAHPVTRGEGIGLIEHVLAEARNPTLAA